MKTFKEVKKSIPAKLKIRKVNTDWYQIDIEKDKWDIATNVVAIFRNKFNEWSVCDGQPEPARKIPDYNRYVFIKFGEAKLFALDLAEAIKNETIYPRMSDNKYSL